MNKSTELKKYIDACIANDIPMNTLTYRWYRLSNGYVLRDMYKRINIFVTNISYSIAFAKHMSSFK